MIPIGGGNGGWSGCAPNPGGAATNSQDLVDQLKLPQKKDFDNYHAVAYHPDASDIWIMGGANRRDAAERELAAQQCQRGCQRSHGGARIAQKQIGLLNRESA